MAEYIDREDLELTLKNYCRFTCAHYPSQRDLYCGMCMLGDVYAFIKKKSVVDVAPVVHGHWVVDEDGNIKCSECGHHGVGDNYCERCGARMDEDEVKELMSMLHGLEDFELKDCALTAEILNALDVKPDGILGNYHAYRLFKCPVCGAVIIGEHNYCSDCGARMDEKAEEEKDGKTD